MVGGSITSYEVDWKDGNTSTSTDGTATHTYPTDEMDGTGLGGGVGLHGQGASGYGGIYGYDSYSEGTLNGGNGSKLTEDEPRYGQGGEISTGYWGGVRIIWGANRSFPNNAI